MLTKKGKGVKMNEREQLILKAIIKHYLDFGESVGSRTLEKKYNIGVSSATIRNAMADLEDKGLIVKTHTSSGRIPTSEGYRLYVEELLKIRDISQEEKVFVLSVFPFFLIEYFGEEFFSWVVSWVVWHKKLLKKTTQEKIKIFVIFYINRHFIVGLNVGLSVALNKKNLININNFGGENE